MVGPAGHNLNKTADCSSEADLDHQCQAVVVLLQARLAVDKRLELLHPIEDRLDTHSGALPVLMKRGNSILAQGCLRMRYSLLRTTRLLPLIHRILRKYLKLRLVHHVMIQRRP